MSGNGKSARAVTNFEDYVAVQQTTKSAENRKLSDLAWFLNDLTISQLAPLPVLYKKIEALSPSRHSHLSLKKSERYKFAKNAEYVPIVADEFFAVQHCYPIVFSISDPACAVALLGGGTCRNQFVDRQGRWLKGLHVPFYVQRYPFISARTLFPDQNHIAIDRAAIDLEENAKRPLYVDGHPTAVVEDAIEFCRWYSTMEKTMLEFCADLEEKGLLTEEHQLLDRYMKSGLSLSRFRIVDEKRLIQLPSDTYLRWGHKGWLPMLQSHLVSLGCLEIYSKEVS